MTARYLYSSAKRDAALAAIEGDAMGQIEVDLWKQILVATIASGNTPFVGPLDPYTTDMAGAWSTTRRLLADYTGPLIRVRRSSDDTELDIAADESGNLDTASLASFCGAGNGFIRLVYDQRETVGNLVQSAGAQQPKVVASGTVIVGDNSNVAQLFDDSNDILQCATATFPDCTFVISAKLIAPNFYEMLLVLNEGVTELRTLGGNDFLEMLLDGGAFITDPGELATSWRVHSASLLGSVPLSKYWIDGALIGSSAIPLSDFNTINLGARNSAGAYCWNGYQSELVLYKAAISDSQRQGVETALGAIL